MGGGSQERARNGHRRGGRHVPSCFLSRRGSPREHGCRAMTALRRRPGVETPHARPFPCWGSHQRSYSGEDPLHWTPVAIDLIPIRDEISLLPPLDVKPRNTLRSLVRRIREPSGVRIPTCMLMRWQSSPPGGSNRSNHCSIPCHQDASVVLTADEVRVASADQS